MFCYEIQLIHHFFFTQIMFLNIMGALGIRHVINIMGYVRDIADRAVPSTQFSLELNILQIKRI